MSHLLYFFATLRWRLMLSFFVSTLMALVMLEGAFVVLPGALALATPQHPEALLNGLDQLAPQAARYLAKTPPDHTGLAVWLRARNTPLINLASGLGIDSARSYAVIPGQNAALMVVDRSGQSLGMLAPSSSGSGDFIGAQTLPQARAVISAALTGSVDTTRLLQTTADGRIFAAAAITDAAQHVRGALVLGVNIGALQRTAFLSGIVTLAYSVIPFTLIASIVGAIFGLLTASGLTRRLSRLTLAADAWSRGEFQVEARDTTHDELGELASDLNGMANQLQRLVATRQELAIIDERQRLARDLHDSVKQQLFVLTLLVTSARDSIGADAPVASTLNEAAQIASQMSQELVGLIRALRPISLESKGLAVALRELAASWSHSTGIALTEQIPDHLPTSVAIEDTLYRVAQEALANVARHSGATAATLEVTLGAEAIRLTVTDNGHGFDLAQAAGAGVGLNSMRERLAALGGSLHTESSPNGTRIEACAHVEQSAAQCE